MTTSPGSLYMLAFDHRSSFSRDLLGIDGAPTRFEARRVADIKNIVYEGFQLALVDGVPYESAGLLVDEQYGTRIARSARGEGVVLAMPVEKSGRAEFEFEFGDEFWLHIEQFDPTYAKVLVRYNPEGDAELNLRQAERLRRLSDWLRGRRRKLLFELLVPAEPEQLVRVGGSVERYDLELRPALVVDAIRELQAAGVEPHIWKIEGLEWREDCERVAEQARSGGRGDVACIVLGRGADDEKVVHWLEQAASVPGFIGFAVGRTLWWNELVAYVADEIDRPAAVHRIAHNYRRMVDAYERCAA
jgi:myo-inositol catabolism protein IolC